MNEIRTEITLEAPVERIWELLADCTLYPFWNPLFKQVTGRMVVGESMNFMVSLPDITPFLIKPKVLSVKPAKGFCWQQTLYFAGLFSWKYCTELEVISLQHSKYIQKFHFGGILGPLSSLAMRGEVTAGLSKMNEALRRWGEKGNIQCLKC
ncbi:MAG: SRPBCC domain-containing protein [Pelobacteraceae bacterium]